MDDQKHGARALAGIAAALAALSACTPLLGGPVPCNDDRDCPSSRPTCTAALCEPGLESAEGEGEGEGEGEPVLAVSLRVASLQPGFADEDVTLAFEALGAESCTLDFDIIPRNPRRLTASELDAGEVKVQLSAVEVQELVDASGGLQAAIARLRCTRGTQQAAGIVAVRWDAGLRLSMEADPRRVPLEGGDVELCWSAPAGATCDVAAPDGSPILQDAAAQGCVTTAVSASLANAVHAFQVACTLDGVWTSSNVSVVQGEGLAFFSASPPLLAEPGVVAFAWEGYASRCELSTLDVSTNVTGELLATSTVGAVEVPVAEETWFTVRCYDAADVMVGVSDLSVLVGPSLREAKVYSINPGNYAWVYRAHLVKGCAVVFTSGDRTAGDPDAPRSADFARRVFAPAEGQPVEVTITCDGFAGQVSATKTFDGAPPPRIVNPHFILASDISVPHIVSMCWDTENAAACWMYNDDDAEPVATSGCLEKQVDAEGGLYHPIVCVDEAGAALDDYGFELGAGSVPSLSVSPRASAAPGPVTFSWTSQAVSSCVLVDGAGDERATGTVGTLTFEVAESATFEVVCQSDQGTVSDRASVVVGPAVTGLRAFADAAADHLTLGWTAENVVRCELTVDNNHGTLTLDNLAPRTAVGAADYPLRQASRGATFDLPLGLTGAGDSTVTLACDDGTGGLAQDSVVVGEPAQAVIHTLQATPLALPAGGGEVDVCWSASGSELCGYFVVTLDGTFVREGSVPPTGCLSTTDGLLPLTETARILFGCGGVIGNAEAEILIPVGPFLIDFTSSPTDLTAPGTAILAWQAANVDECAVLDAEGVVVATGAASDSTAVVLNEGAFFTLACDHGAVTREIYVAVGPTIIELSVEPTQDNLGFVYAFRTALVTSCEMRVTGNDGYAHPIRSTPDLGCRQSCGESWWWDYASHGAPTVRAVCATEGGSIERSVTGAMPAALPPAATLVATPDWLPTGGGEVELCWSAPDADGCVVDGVPAANSGCETRNVSVETWASLTCSNEYGVTNESLVLLVGPSIRSFTVDRTSLIVDEGATVTLSWDTVDVVTCVFAGPFVDGMVVAPTGSLELTLPDIETNYAISLFCSDADGPPEGRLGDSERYVELFTY